jgi:hypothetical protein
MNLCFPLSIPTFRHSEQRERERSEARDRINVDCFVAIAPRNDEGIVCLPLSAQQKTAPTRGAPTGCAPQYTNVSPTQDAFQQLPEPARKGD